MTDDQTTSRVTGVIPTTQKEDLAVLAHEQSDPFDKVTVSMLVAEAIEQYLNEADIPDYELGENGKTEVQA